MANQRSPAWRDVPRMAEFDEAQVRGYLDRARHPGETDTAMKQLARALGADAFGDDTKGFVLHNETHMDAFLGLLQRHYPNGASVTHMPDGDVLVCVMWNYQFIFAGLEECKARSKMYKAARKLTLSLECSAVSFAKWRARGANEDAFWIGEDSAGVFDGVSSWAVRNPRWDAGQVARNLAACCAKQEDGTPPRKRLEAALMGLPRDRPGSATAALAALCRPEPGGPTQLRVLTIGDAGVHVFRGSKCLWVSEPTMVSREHNVPEQVGVDSNPPSGMQPVDWSTKKEHVIPVLAGDVVVLFTDGMEHLGAERLRAFEAAVCRGNMAGALHIVDEAAHDPAMYLQDDVTVVIAVVGAA